MVRGVVNSFRAFSGGDKDPVAAIPSILAATTRAASGLPPYDFDLMRNASPAEIPYFAA